jgi:hypothetical protein
MGYGMGLFGLIPFVFGTLDAQSASSLTIDAGALNIQQPYHAAATAGALTISARRATSLTAMSASVLLLQATDKSTAAQGTLGAELILPRWSSLRVEASGTATTFGALANDNGSSRDGFIRPQYVNENFGVFSTLGAGSTRRASARFYSLAWDAGAWMQRGRVTGLLALRRSFTNDFPLMESSDIFLSRPGKHYSVQDVQGVITARISRVELQASGAVRNGFDATDGHGSSLFGSATMHLNSHVALLINGVKQLADLLSGVPEATVVGASLRVSLPGRRSNVAPLLSNSDTISRPASPFATQINRHVGGGASVIVHVDAPPSATVELSGSFNDWTAVPVPRSANGFALIIELPSGTHRIAVRVNGGEWKSPAGLARIKDDLGGEAGLVVVP